MNSGARVIMAGLYLIVSGCASTYEVPQAMEAVRASLDAPRARDILASAPVKSGQAHGLCASNVLLDRTSPSFVELNNSVMVFEEYAKKDRDIAVARDFPSLDRRRDRFEFDFGNVMQVRVLSAGAVSPISR